MLLNERCCEREKQILCSCVWASCQLKHRKKLSHVKNFQLGDLQNSRGEWMVERRTVQGKDLQKAPFLFLSPRSLWRLSCFSDCYLLPLYPFLKPPSFPYRLSGRGTHSAELLLSCSFISLPSPQASPTVILSQLDNAKKLNREVATIFLWLNEVLELSCTPKKEMTIILANELFSFS